jgi:putative transposase
MSRYRLVPSAAQEAVLRDHCTHARFIWNLAVEQQSWWRPGRASAPGYLAQCRQLTAARAEHDWLRAGSQMVQQQALRDYAQAMTQFFDGTHRRPGPTGSPSTGPAAGMSPSRPSPSLSSHRAQGPSWAWTVVSR